MEPFLVPGVTEQCLEDINEQLTDILNYFDPTIDSTAEAFREHFNIAIESDTDSSMTLTNTKNVPAGSEEITDILNDLNEGRITFQIENEPISINITSESEEKIIENPPKRQRGRPKKEKVPKGLIKRGRPSIGPDGAIANVKQFENTSKSADELKDIIIREQNRAASFRYREKQKRELEEAERDIEFENDRNKKLKLDIDELKSEVEKYKQLAESSFRPQIIIVQQDLLSQAIANSDLELSY